MPSLTLQAESFAFSGGTSAMGKEQLADPAWKLFRSIPRIQRKTKRQIERIARPTGILKFIGLQTTSA